MDDAPAKPPKPDTQAPTPPAKTEKAQRLAAALRENLKRRKAAGRAPAADKPRN